MRGYTLSTNTIFMINHKTIVTRWVLALLLLVIIITSINLWLSSRPFIESALPLSEKNKNVSLKTETLTVEKLNHQVQVKQLRKALIHEQPLSVTEAVSDQDLDQKIESLEQELQQLSQEQ